MEIFYQEMSKIDKIEARKRVIETYLETGSIRKTARLWGTSRGVVRKWVRRYESRGEEGLKDLSRRPHYSPRKTCEDMEKKVWELRKDTGYGKRRLRYLLWVKEGINLPESTIANILRRGGIRGRKKRRKVFYPARWAYDEDRPFRLAQVDTKDIYDKSTLGTLIWTHITRKKLPRYQWTFCEGRTRLRFIAYSRELNLTNGL